MKRSLRIAGRGLVTATVALVLGFGVVQSVSAATRTSGPSAVFGCVEGDCNVYCQGLGFGSGTCPRDGGHCICG